MEEKTRIDFSIAEKETDSITFGYYETEESSK
jgi:hypothetical protein